MTTQPGPITPDDLEMPDWSAVNPQPWAEVAPAELVVDEPPADTGGQP